jgi:hypothetical protein
MNANIEYGLEGAFKVDVYSGKQFVRSTDWFSNFITNTGIWYPSVYPFADCFRFLSLGASAIHNTGGAVSISRATTGLYEPYVNGIPVSINGAPTTYQQATYIGWPGYAIGDADNQTSACSTVLTEDGPRFYRAWVIPTGDYRTLASQEITINEFMVSPSSGIDPTGRYAFSRIAKTVVLAPGEKAVISYQLKVRLLSTGTYLPSGSFQTGKADVEYDQELVSGWRYASGWYRQVLPGLAGVDQFGATYVPRYGAVMEPCKENLGQFVFYLSPDNAAFDVNMASGGKLVGTNPDAILTLAYLSDGLMGILKNTSLELNSTDAADYYDATTVAQKNEYYYKPFEQRLPVSESPTANIPINIRLGDTSQNLPTPNLGNYIVDNGLEGINYQTTQYMLENPISYATRGLSGIDYTRSDFGQKAVFSTRVFRMGLEFTGGRWIKQSRRTMFAPVSSMGTNTRFGSLVAAYCSNPASALGERTYFPMIDCQFYDTSGNFMMQHYRYLKPYMTERGSGVAWASIKIRPLGNNVTRYVDRPTAQGPVTYNAPDWTNIPIDFQLSGNSSSDFVDGQDYVTWTGSDLFPCSGWGGVIGISGGDDWYLVEPDCALADHAYGNPAVPHPTGHVYWPRARHPTGHPMHMEIDVNTVRYFNPNFEPWASMSPKSGLTSGELISLYAYDWTTNSAGLCAPSGDLRNYEYINATTGYRLLPNHGVPSPSGNIYYPYTGGLYPGLSMDNGLDLYLSITWQSPCGNGTDEC